MASGGDKICLLSSNFGQLPMDHTAQLVFATTPDVIPVQLHKLLRGLLLQFWKSRNVATPSPFLSSHRSLEGSTRRSAASCFSALNTLDQRSPFSGTTRSSNSGRSSFRADLASNSSAPPTGYVTSYRLTTEKNYFLMERLECFVSRLMPSRHSLQL